MIIGLGLDLVEIRRIASVLERQGEAFLDRILASDESGRERVANHDGPAHIAGLFAAKEAVMKALGTGMAGASFREIAIRHHGSGQPRVELTGDTLAKATSMGIGGWQLSITHSRTTAAAVAIALEAGSSRPN